MKINKLILDIIYKEICDRYDPHQYGDCNQINSTAAVVFKQLGKHPVLYSGYVETVTPVIEDDGNEEFTVKHVFLMMDNQIYDFAASQMQDLLDIDLNDSYFVGENEAYRRVSEHPVDIWSDESLVQLIVDKIRTGEI